MGRRLLITGGTFSWCLKGDDTHFTVLPRWHAELHISVFDVRLTDIEHGLFHEVSSHCREGTVRSHDQVSILHYSFISGRPVRDRKFSVNAKIDLVQGGKFLHKVCLSCKRLPEFITERIPSTFYHRK
jgi:hypothetical protein